MTLYKSLGAWENVLFFPLRCGFLPFAFSHSLIILPRRHFRRQTSFDMDKMIIPYLQDTALTSWLYPTLRTISSDQLYRNPSHDSFVDLCVDDTDSHTIYRWLSSSTLRDSSTHTTLSSDALSENHIMTYKIGISTISSRYPRKKLCNHVPLKIS